MTLNNPHSGHFHMQAHIDFRPESDRMVKEVTTVSDQTRITKYVTPEFEILDCQFITT